MQKVLDEHGRQRSGNYALQQLIYQSVDPTKNNEPTNWFLMSTKRYIRLAKQRSLELLLNSGGRCCLLVQAVSLPAWERYQSEIDMAVSLGNWASHAKTTENSFGN
jgi:hypothetical protein